MVEKLTQEQKAAIIPFREKWIERILRTEKNDDEIKRGIENVYAMAGLKKPKKVWIMDSMFGVQIAYNFIINNEIKLSNIGNNIENNIWSNIRSNIENNIWSNIENNIGNNIWNNIMSNIGNNIENNIRSNIRSNIGNNIGNNIWSNIRSNIGNNIWSNKLKFQGFSSNEASYLQWYIYQIFFYEFGLLEKDELYEKEKSYIDSVIDSWAVFYSEDIAIVSRKPEIIRDERRRLHSTTKPAVIFKDGYEIYYLHGIEFPKDLWTKIVNKTISAKELLTLPNQDQKIVALQVYGWKKLLDEIQPTVLDERYLMINNELLRHQVLEVKQDDWIGRFLRFTDPADKDEGLLRVDHKLQETATVEGARRYGFRPLITFLKAEQVEWGREG